MQIDPEQRKRLEERRRKLQEELARQARRDTISGKLSLLDQCGIAYRLIYETDPYYVWINRHFKVTGDVGQVDWSAVEGRLHLPAESMDEASSWLGRLAGTVPDAGGDVVLLWSNGNSPAVGLALVDLVTCPELIASDFETWVISEKGGWLVEYTVDDGLNFGFQT